MKPNKIIKLLTIGSIAGIALSGLSELSTPHTNTVVFNNIAAAAASTNPSNKIIGAYKAPSGIIYTLIQKTSKIFIFRRPDGSVSTKTFSSKQAVVNYLKINSPAKKTISTVTPKKTSTVSQNTINIKPITSSATQTQVVSPNPAPTQQIQSQPIPNTTTRAS